MIRIYITGMPQAGSTLCYNIVRLLVEYSGYPVEGWTQDRGLVYRKEGTKPGEYILIKQHNLSSASPINFNKASGDHVINIKRDLRDTVASAYRKFPDKDKFNILEMCERNIKWYESWVRVTDYEWVYEKYKANSVRKTEDLQKALRFNLTKEQIEEIVLKAESFKKQMLNFSGIEERLNFEDMTRMDKAQITNKGIIGGYKESLSLEQIKLIEDTHGGWLKEHGYME